MNDQRLGNAPGTLGPMYMSCQVTAVDDQNATVVDQFGRNKTIPSNILRSPYRPKVNERWILDRTLGYWAFAAVIDPIPTPLKFVSTSPVSPATWTIVHDLDTEDVSVTVRETTSGFLPYPTTHVIDANTVTVSLIASHPAGYYTAVVIG